MAKPRFPGFAACMRLMRKRSPVSKEEGFYWLLSRAAEFVEPLVAEFREERDHGLKYSLLELIAEAKDPRALSLLAEQLQSPDEPLRSCAIRGLQALNTREARKALFEAKALPFSSPTIDASTGSPHGSVTN